MQRHCSEGQVLNFMKANSLQEVEAERGRVSWPKISFLHEQAQMQNVTITADTVGVKYFEVGNLFRLNIAIL